MTLSGRRFFQTDRGHNCKVLHKYIKHKFPCCWCHSFIMKAAVIVIHFDKITKNYIYCHSCWGGCGWMFFGKCRPCVCAVCIFNQKCIRTARLNVLQLLRSLLIIKLYILNREQLQACIFSTHFILMASCSSLYIILA